MWGYQHESTHSFIPQVFPECQLLPGSTFDTGKSTESKVAMHFCLHETYGLVEETDVNQIIAQIHNHKLINARK